ncbi:MAG TPA: hypothetical protein VGG74_01445 [Kofleriaceae bacterium]|jgi:hypothetical protein
MSTPFADELSGARVVEFSAFASIARKHAEAIATDDGAALEHAAIAIVFGHAAVELYINDAGARLLGDKFFEKYLDRADIVAKWAVVSRMAGARVDPGGEAMALLGKLKKARNDLMHPKIEGIDIGTINPDELLGRLTKESRLLPLARDVPRTLDRLRDAALAFEGIDRSLADEFLVTGLVSS